MKIIRQNTFETNSSSTHSLVILSKQEYNAWRNDEVVLDIYKGEVKPLDPNKNIIRNEDGSVNYNGTHYEGMFEVLEEHYEDFDDDYAIKEYIDEYAEVEQKELDDKVIMSIYRGERW